MTAVGGVFYAFYYNNLFPAQVFDIQRSIELILGPSSAGSAPSSARWSAPSCSRRWAKP